MTTRAREIRATPQQVWDVLADGWLYPLWVVGASRMREVDDSWPDAGSRLHHSVGSWPVLINDTTEVLECRPSRSLLLRARAWPTGEAEVRIDLEPSEGGTVVTITEDVVRGPAQLVPRPVRAAGLSWRNDETLRRLAMLCEGRQ